MEFTKDIFFDTNPINGKIAKLTYSGMLFKNGSEHVNVVYGFGADWNNTTTTPMEKHENGFTAEIKIQDYETFNFCFSNEYNNWDNNNSFNYIIPILPSNSEENSTEGSNIEESNIENTSENTDYADSIDDILDSILGNTVQNSIANDKLNETNSINDILNYEIEEPLPEIEQLFAELFDGVDVNEKPEKENIQKAEVTQKSESEELAELLNEIEGNSSIATDIATNDVDLTQYGYDAEEANQELVNLFNELFAVTDENEVTEPEKFDLFKEVDDNSNNNLSNNSNNNLENSNTQYFENDPVQAVAHNDEITQNLNVSDFNLDGLVSDLLEPVVSQKAVQASTSEHSLFEDINAENEEDSLENKLPVLQASDDLSVSPRKLGTFYLMKKRIKLALYKLFVKGPQEFARQLGFGKD